MNILLLARSGNAHIWMNDKYLKALSYIVGKEKTIGRIQHKLVTHDNIVQLCVYPWSARDWNLYSDTGNGLKSMHIAYLLGDIQYLIPACIPEKTSGVLENYNVLTNCPSSIPTTSASSSFSLSISDSLATANAGSDCLWETKQKVQIGRASCRERV